MRILLVCGAVLLALALAEAHDPIATRVTWEGDISRIVQARCLSCHTTEGPGRMPLTSYDEARPWAKAIKEEVMTRREPKWHAVRGYGDFSNDPSLSAFEIALIVAWVDGGAPKGVEPLKRPSIGVNASSGLKIGPAPPGGAVRSGEAKSTQGERMVTIPCGDQAAPEGTLLAIRPELDKDRSVGVAVRFPDGRREIVVWVRGFDPRFPTTYRLRVPLELPPTSIITSEPSDRCRLTLTLAAH
jgi:hypothetical protein